ncbi:MAG: hypothetical protein ACRDLM_11895 [Gaiellaceae bacterium]
MRAISHLTGCGWFWAWALVGVGVALGFLSLGVLALAPVVLVAVFLARRHAVNPFGLVAGIGLMLLAIAYIQRSGQSYDPVHWLVAGLVFLTAGLVGHAWRGAGSG